MANTKFRNFLFGASLVGGLSVGASACQKDDKDDKYDFKKEIKTQDVTSFGFFKKRMHQITPQVMLETILVEGVELDNKGLCRPYKKTTAKGEDKWTMGFGLTQLDGKPVTKDTRHITIQEAWEKSIKFYEDDESYFFMWCYEIGINGLQLDNQHKALGFASIVYNSNTNCIDGTKNNPNHDNRNAALRGLYEKYGDNVTADQVQFVFQKYPVKKPTSFYKALDGGNTKDWANALGNFCAEGGGIYWRRWLEGQIAMGNITYKDLLDLPMYSMYEFWCIIGGQKDALFDKDTNGVITVNPDGLKKFKKWAKNPVTKHGKTNTNETLRQVLNSIDSSLVSKIENETFTPITKKEIAYIVADGDIYTCEQKNDVSFAAYNKNDYELALSAGKSALKLAKNNKQLGAAYYNIGMAHMAMKHYARAKKCFEKSLAYNKTNAAKKQMDIAQQNQSERRDKSGKYATGVLAVAALAYGGRKYYLRQQQKKYYGRNGR